MLKLERASKSGEINVRLRTRERTFNPVFCVALGIAIVLHLLPIILFHVQPFKIESQWVFPSVKVNSELGMLPESDASILALLEENKLLTPNFQPPPRSTSRLPAFPENSLSERLKPAQGKKNHESLNPIDHITLPPNLFCPNLSFSYNSFAIAISGRLGESELTEYMIPTPLTSHTLPMQKLIARYDVRMDEKTGRVFWIRRLESSKRQDLDQQAEKILRSLCFKHDPKNLETEGVVEITFAVP